MIIIFKNSPKQTNKNKILGYHIFLKGHVAAFFHIFYIHEQNVMHLLRGGMLKADV
jgi:hypothetical protein